MRMKLFQLRCSFNLNHHVVEFFPQFVGGRMVTRTEPMLLLYLLPLSCHASSQMPTDLKALAFLVSPIPHLSYAHHMPNQSRFL